MARTRRPRTKVIRFRPVSLDVDETATHYLVFVSPHLEAQALGIGYHRSRLAKCTCLVLAGRNGEVRCKWCRGFTAAHLARYVGRLLRSYPTVPVRVPVEQVQGTRLVLARVAA